MKKKILFRAATLGAAAVLSAGALMMFAGCSSKNPEVTITYTFNGKDYAVDYVLSRTDAPNTVQHFIELADAGFYDGLVVHNYDSSRIYTGGYRIENDSLVEVDYYSTVRSLETEKNITFTQSVWADEACTEGLYSLYGEFSDNGVEQEYGRELSYTTGALVMYYTDKGNFNGNVTVKRADGGSDNDGQETQQAAYKYNSATSLFYTFTGENDTNSSAYAVFGMAKNYEEQMTNGLLAAISDYQDTLEENVSFTVEQTVPRNQYDPFEEVRKAGDRDTFNTPMDMPIVVKSVVVTKY